MPATYFDEFWLYPEISSQVFLLVKSKKDRAAITNLIEKGDTKAIENWITESNPEDIVERLLRLGIPSRGSFAVSLFDEILIGTRSFEDGAGTTDYILSRRVGPNYYHRVYSDGTGVVMYHFTTDGPMTRLKFEELTTSPTPWEESGFEDEIADSSASSIWEERGRRKAKLAPPPLPTPEDMLGIVGQLQRDGRMPSFEQLQAAIESAAEGKAKQPTKKKRKR